MRIDFKWYNEVHHKAELRTRRGEEKRGLQDSITSESFEVGSRKKKNQKIMK